MLSVIVCTLVTTFSNAEKKFFQHPMKMNDGKISWKLRGIGHQENNLDSDHYNTFQEDEEHPCHLNLLKMRRNSKICNEGNDYFKRGDDYWDRDCSYGGHCSSKTSYHTGVDYDLPLHEHKQDVKKTEIGEMHGDLDIIHSTNDGIIEYVSKNIKGKDHWHGNTVVIKHENVGDYGIVYSSYSHLSAVYVKKGDVVKRGQDIGQIGGSANELPSTWIHHLHFEIKKSPGIDNIGAPDVDCKNGKKPAFGYSNKKPDDCGYYDPLKFIDKIFIIDLSDGYAYFHNGLAWRGSSSCYEANEFYEAEEKDGGVLLKKDLVKEASDNSVCLYIKGLCDSYEVPLVCIVENPLH